MTVTLCSKILKRGLAARSTVAPISKQLSSARLFSTRSANSEASPAITLYQYQICPFCNIVKTFMSYADVKHEVVEVNPLTKAELKFSQDYKKVPIAILDGQQMNGSDDIVKTILKQPNIESFLSKKLQNVSLEQFSESPEVKRWVAFAKDDLATLLYPNICRTWNDSYKAFEYVKNVDTFSPFQKAAVQNVGSLAMYFAASKIKKKRNITDERQALNEMLIQLENEGLKEDKEFLSGSSQPHLGDLAVYGVLRAIEGMPVHRELMESREPSSPLPAWYERMKTQIQHVKV